jgi:hypothetical protein
MSSSPGVLADHVGVEFIRIGEHHTEDFQMEPGEAGNDTGPRDGGWAVLRADRALSRLRSR